MRIVATLSRRLGITSSPSGRTQGMSLRERSSPRWAPKFRNYRVTSAGDFHIPETRSCGRQAGGTPVRPEGGRSPADDRAAFAGLGGGARVLRDLGRKALPEIGRPTPPTALRSRLVAQRLPIPLRIVCVSYSDSAIWKVVTSPSRLSYRPPGSVLESRCWSLSQVLKADRPNWFDEGSAVPVASKNRLAASTR